MFGRKKEWSDLFTCFENTWFMEQQSEMCKFSSTCEIPENYVQVEEGAKS